MKKSFGKDDKPRRRPGSPDTKSFESLESLESLEHILEVYPS